MTVTPLRKTDNGGRARSGPLFHAMRRQELERWIDRAISFLDAMDGDPDFEPYLADTNDDREADIDAPNVRDVSEGDDDCDLEPNGDESEKDELDQ